MIATMDAGMPIDTKAIDPTYGCVLMIPVVLGAAVVVAVAAAWVVAAWAHVAAYTDIAVSGATGEDLPILSEDAIMLYLDQTKSLDTKDLTEDEYLAVIRDIFSETNITDDPETANKLFQYGCGTAEHLINKLSGY